MTIKVWAVAAFSVAVIHGICIEGA